MNELLFGYLDNNYYITDSLEISKRFEKRHDTILRYIRRIIDSNESMKKNFLESEYKTIRNRKYPIYLVSKKGEKILITDFLRLNDDYVDIFEDSQKEKDMLEKGFVKIKKFPGYMINKKGEIFSLRSNKMMYLRINGDGYLSVNLMKNNKYKTLRVHRLLVESFIGEIPENLVINHIDGDKINNDLSNLEIVTQKENAEHAREVLGKILKPVYKIDYYSGDIMDFYKSITIAAKFNGVSVPMMSKYCKDKKIINSNFFFTLASEFKRGECN